MKRIGTIFFTLLLLAVMASSAFAAAPAASIPTISIVSVVPDTSVTLRADNYPANVDFDIRMNTFGTLGIGGTLVGTLNSGAGGSFTFTVNIPTSLKGQEAIAVRLDSKPGYYSYNWFWNTPKTPTTPPSGPTLPAGVIPTFTILEVATDKTVTIQTANLPKNDTFEVLMNTYGTLGVGGTKVATVDTSAGGTQKFTFDIPTSLKGQQRIAIRMQSTKSPYFAFNWFWNSTTTAPSTPPITPRLSPSFSITSVVKDSKVTITTRNFPANDTFDVLMNTYGTLGVGGTKVATVSSDGGGSLSFTFDIPSGLKGQTRIAIRLQSSTSKYYAFNWFWNNDAP